jgi:RNA polymerase sigma-70 factor (ECF subfamily)
VIIPRPTRLAVLPSPPASPTDESSLVERLSRAELEAVATAYDRWHQRVRALAGRLLSDDAAAEDVVQEVFAALPRAVRRFRQEAPLETFLLAIAVKRARHHLRSVIRRRRLITSLAPEAMPGPDPEHLAYRRQLANRLSASLDRLPSAQREAFVLCQVEELTSAEAAVLAGVPEPTIRTRVFHARRRLRELLCGEHGE